MNIKRIISIIFSLWLTSTCTSLLYGEEVINIQHIGNHNDHSGQPLFPADQPDVYYDDDADIIIVDGTGYSTYYDVEITSLSTFDLVLSTQVNGTYVTIDVASLPDDNYEIVITSSLNNVFEGYFTM